MSPSNIEVLLSELDIFTDLEEEELAALADISEEFEYTAGSNIAYQRDVAEKFFILLSGRIYAFQVDNKGVVRDSKSYLPGEYFEDAWLFTPGVHQFTLRGSEAGRLIIIDQNNFLEFLKDYPEVVDFLYLSEEAQEAADSSLAGEKSRKIRSLSLLQDEILEYRTRRTKWLLALYLVVPLTLFLLFAAFLIGSDFLSPGTASFLLLVSAVIFLAVAAWQSLDWSNDYFVITSKHLIHHEFSLRRIQVIVTKTPVDQIQSVEIEKPSLLATLLNTGTVRVTTSAHTASIIFDFISDPDEVKQIVNRLREQVKSLDEGRAQTLMRASIEEHFNAQPAYTRVGGMQDEEYYYEDYETPLELLGRIYSGIFHGVGSRVEDEEVITYRKHIFTMFKRVLIPILFVLVLIGAINAISSATLKLIFYGLLLIDLLWLIWRFEDWRNDTFQITDRYVIDIDRKPFGFGESRKQAELGNIQNVNAKKPGFLATLFNYGYVQIETAGATADITFEKVVNPNRVQSDIFQRREAFKQSQDIRQGEKRRKEYAVLLDVYQQALEQNRIPQRTVTEDLD